MKLVPINLHITKLLKLLLLILLLSDTLIIFPTNLICSALSCSICRHRGVSMTPPSAPNSRFVFDSTSETCDEENITCESDEDFCIAATAKAGDKKFWVQKGCVRSTGGGRGAGCTEELFDASNAKSLPVGVTKGKFKMSVCVCNTKDFCNRGQLSRLLRNNGSSNGRTLVGSLSLETKLLLLLIISFIKLFS